jgi:hypothetical protein
MQGGTYLDHLSETYGAPSVVQLSCQDCGAPVEWGGRGARRRFCDVCRRSRARERARAQPRRVEGPRDRAGYVSPSNRGTCADCGGPMMRGTKSLPQGEARCHPCRRARPAANTLRARRPPVRPVVTHCRRCDAPIPNPSRARRYCTAECFRRARNARGSGGVRPSATQRGYGVEHQELRMATVEAAVGTACVLCGEVMDDPARMHLDHTEDRSGYRGFAHDDCNVRDGARRGGAATRARRLEGASRAR